MVRKISEIIDSHCHLGQGTYKKVTLSDLLRVMDAAGVSRAVICTVDEYIAVRNREGNDEIIAACRQYPDRFWGLAAVNPWFGQEGADEFRRCLDAGMVGLKINSHLQGFLLNDPIMYPLLEICQHYGVPAYFHTGTPITSMPWQLTELAGHFPEVRFIQGHMGWSDFWYDTIAAAAAAPNVWLETSLMYMGLLSEAPEVVGTHRILFGSDFPQSDIALEIENIVSFQKFDQEMVRAILHDNAAAFWPRRR